MTKTYIAAILMLLSFKASAQEVLSEQSMKLCQDVSIQATCASTCAPACSANDFVDNNFDFCDRTGMLGGELSAQPDDPSCAAKFSASSPLAVDHYAVTSSSGELHESGLTDGSRPLQSEASGNSECDVLESRFAKRRCELAKVTPQCARSVAELEGKSRFLVTQMEMELGKYGELLTRHWNDVENRSLLCAFRKSDLESILNAVSKSVDAMRREMIGVQVCQSELETWIRSITKKQNSQVDFLQIMQDDANRLQTLFGPLQRDLEELNNSFNQFQNAEQIVGEIISLHVLFCDPNGTVPTVTSEEKS